jgi:hypothetical protein
MSDSLNRPDGAGASGVTALERVRVRREETARDRAAITTLSGSVLSLAAMLGTEVRNAAGRNVGRLRDVVVHWTTRGAYPPVRAVVLRSGRHNVLIGARWLETSPPGTVRLRSSHAHASAVERHRADVALAADVLDRQVVDADGVQVVRPADLYLAVAQDRIELVGVEVGVGALLRRLGPRALRSRFRPQRVIDWASISAFVPARSDGDRHRGRHSDIAGATGAGIALDRSASEVKRLGPRDIQDTLDQLDAERRTQSA